MKNRRKGFAIVCLALLAWMCFGAAVFADLGPKPKTTIILENAPEEAYYLDLLIPDENHTPYSNLYEGEAQFDAKMLAMLKESPVKGWHAALTVGTPVPLFGTLTGERDGTSATHRFSYFGVPDTYRIFIVTKSGERYLSDIVHKTVFQETVTATITSGSITVSSISLGEIDVTAKSPVATCLLQFLATFLPTLLIEFLVFLLFRIPWKRNLPLILVTNLVTQGALMALMTFRMTTGGILDAYFLFVPLEIVIFLAEATVYAVAMRETTRRRAVLYGLLANAASMGAGLLLLKLASRIG